MIHFFIYYAKLLLPKLGITSEEGQTLAEYALLFLLIVLVVIGALTIFGTTLRDYWTYISNEIDAVL